MHTTHRPRCAELIGPVVQQGANVVIGDGDNEAGAVEKGVSKFTKRLLISKKKRGRENKNSTRLEVRMNTSL